MQMTKLGTHMVMGALLWCAVSGSAKADEMVTTTTTRTTSSDAPSAVAVNSPSGSVLFSGQWRPRFW